MPVICNTRIRHVPARAVLPDAKSCIYKRGLLRCRLILTGNARSLQLKDGNRYRFPRFLLINQSFYANEGMTEAVVHYDHE